MKKNNLLSLILAFVGAGLAVIAACLNMFKFNDMNFILVATAAVLVLFAILGLKKSPVVLVGSIASYVLVVYTSNQLVAMAGANALYNNQLFMNLVFAALLITAMVFTLKGKKWAAITATVVLSLVLILTVMTTKEAFAAFDETLAVIKQQGIKKVDKQLEFGHITLFLGSLAMICSAGSLVAYFAAPLLPEKQVAEKAAPAAEATEAAKVEAKEEAATEEKAE